MHFRNAMILLVLGIAGLAAWRFVQPMLDEASQASVSDTGEKGLIHIAVDGWVGYFPLCSPVMKKQLRREGWGLKCTDDQADYDARFKALKAERYDYVVATVDSYLLNAEKYNFPGPIIAVIDESKGGDAIVARSSIVDSIEALKTAQDLNVAFTPDSPSHHLIKAVSSHFNVPQFKNKRLHIEANGSEEALNYLIDGRADIAVLWEPEVSKALENENFVRILGTEVTQELVVDILVAAQDVIKDEEDKTLSLLKSYYRTLKHYRSSPNELVDDIRRHYKIKESVANAILAGVAWATLAENANRWFGVDANNFSSESIIHALGSASDILIDHGDFERSPIPNDDPYFLTNSSYIKKLYEAYGSGKGFSGDASPRDKLAFSSLSAKEWDLLKDVGSLKARKISFSSGSATLTADDQRQIDKLVADLKHYPVFRVEVRGHTGLRGDKEANLELSQARADAVVKYINVAHNVDKNRVRALGFGGTKPLPKKVGESNRAYGYRLPRVEIALVGEVY
ncbi:MAG: OmpA family protein [Acidiferrobacterales bacterium]|nr:OmpA family protein [Acidiferrobacterales bacterium]